jgi:hypothetical protein
MPEYSAAESKVGEEATNGWFSLLLYSDILSSIFLQELNASTAIPAIAMKVILCLSFMVDFFAYLLCASGVIKN